MLLSRTATEPPAPHAPFLVESLCPPAFVRLELHAGLCPSDPALSSSPRWLTQPLCPFVSGPQRRAGHACRLQPASSSVCKQSCRCPAPAPGLPAAQQVPPSQSQSYCGEKGRGQTSSCSLRPPEAGTKSFSFPTRQCMQQMLRGQSRGRRNCGWGRRALRETPQTPHSGYTFSPSPTSHPDPSLDLRHFTGSSPPHPHPHPHPTLNHQTYLLLLPLPGASACPLCQFQKTLKMQADLIHRSPAAHSGLRTSSKLYAGLQSPPLALAACWLSGLRSSSRIASWTCLVQSLVLRGSAHFQIKSVFIGL
jgi:hypothetical protein